LRDNTERPETIEVGSNMLAGTSPERILEAANQMVSREKGWVSPFGDGKTTQKIISILMKK
jgi:UDP-N-acetylglucosamine 2-epimerase (non-hydrolysing)